MEGKTYYMILGVSSTESTAGIRAAYRDLAKKLHPDVAGEHTTRAFQELTEAYNVLSDPELRRAYNDNLERAAQRGDGQSVRRRPREPLAGSKSELEDLSFEVLLTAEEASSGCVVPIGVPVFRRCPQCGGSGHPWAASCAYCQQRGMVEDTALLRIRVPPSVRSGSIYEIPLRGLGIHDFVLRLHVFVEA